MGSQLRHPRHLEIVDNDSVNCLHVPYLRHDVAAFRYHPSSSKPLSGHPQPFIRHQLHNQYPSTLSIASSAPCAKVYNGFTVLYFAIQMLSSTIPCLVMASFNSALFLPIQLSDVLAMSIDMFMWVWKGMWQGAEVEIFVLAVRVYRKRKNVC